MHFQATKLVTLVRTTISRSVGSSSSSSSSNWRLNWVARSTSVVTSHKQQQQQEVRAAAMASPQEISCSKIFGGYNRRYKHDSSSTGTAMTFTVYFPPSSETEKVPVLYWLSGLTCTDENFIQKSGAQRKAAALGIALVTMDTSPRGLNVEGASSSWDFGEGAGFYVNATQEKWKNWRMYDYVTKELPAVLNSSFPNLNTERASLFGHSMGGHGALSIFLRNPLKYRSVSAFAPIANPTRCPWGEKAFTGYLGEDKSKWEESDATLLAGKYKGPEFSFTILIDQGDADKFYKEGQLLPENFEKAAKAAGIPVELRIQPGYDHSYFFIATFVDEHILFHANALGISPPA